MRVNPPALPATNPLFRLSIMLASSGQIYENLLDYYAQAGIGVNFAVMNAWLTAWQAAVQTAYRACIPPTVTVNAYLIAELVVGTTPTLVTPVGPLAGTAGATALTGTVAAVLTKYTALKGQHGRGRVYMPSIPNTFTTPGTDPNVLNAAGIAAYSALNVALMTPIVAGGTTWNLCVSTRPLKPAVLVTRAANVANMVVELTLGNIRRRREGRGI